MVVLASQLETDLELSDRCLCLGTSRNICTMGLAIPLVTQFENLPTDVSTDICMMVLAKGHSTLHSTRTLRQVSLLTLRNIGME